MVPQYLCGFVYYTHLHTYTEWSMNCKKKSHENPALSSLFPCPRPLGDIERNPQNSHATVPACAASQTPVGLGCSSGFCSSQEIVIHRACFFAKCNYPRPCVYGWGMVESNRKWLFFVLKAFFISGAVGTSAAFSEWQCNVLLFFPSKINDLICWCLVLEMTFMWNKRNQINNKKKWLARHKWKMYISPPPQLSCLYLHAIHK